VARESLADKLITKLHPKSPVSEAFRSLRTSLHFVSPNFEYRSLLVTSPGPSEGKSTVISNLAVSLAQTGKSVLVIDADLRKPSQHKVFGIVNSAGLTNVLVGERDFESLFQDAGVENLKVLTSGPIPPNPAELLDTPMMRALIKEATEKFDFVLVDSPPVLPITDAAVLASQVDGILLIVKSGQTRINLAKEAKDMLENARGKIVGVILNQIRYDGDDYRYYYYYGHGRDRKQDAKPTVSA